MINLLPSEEKQKLILIKRGKLAIIYGMVALVFLVCMILILFSIKFYLLSETDYQKNILKQSEKQIQTPDFANSNSTVKKYNAVLSQLGSFYKKEIYFSQALKIITNIPRPAGVSLINYTLDRNDKGMIQASVAGASDTRDNLLIFRTNAESDSEIKNPYFSPESWITPKNVNFSLTFEIDAKEQQ